MTLEDFSFFVLATLSVLILGYLFFRLLIPSKKVMVLPGDVISPLSPVYVMNCREDVLHVIRWQKDRTPYTSITLDNGMRHVGHNMWFDDTTQFGMRVVIDSTGDWFVIFAPIDGNHLAYLVTGTGRIYFTHDKAELSFMSWSYVSRSDHPFVTKAMSDFPTWDTLLHVSYIMLDVPPVKWDKLNRDADKILFHNQEIPIKSKT